MKKIVKKEKFRMGFEQFLNLKKPIKFFLRINKFVSYLIDLKNSAKAMIMT